MHSDFNKWKCEEEEMIMMKINFLLVLIVSINNNNIEAKCDRKSETNIYMYIQFILITYYIYVNLQKSQEIPNKV